jgi:hypothetical protein
MIKQDDFRIAAYFINFKPPFKFIKKFSGHFRIEIRANHRMLFTASFI